MSSSQKTFLLIAIAWGLSTFAFVVVYRDKLVLLCAGTGSANCLRVSLSLPSELNYRSSDFGGTTPLLYYLDHVRHAPGDQAVSGVTLLLRSGADPDFADEEGWTPLMVASANGNAAVVRTLLENGAQVNKRAESKTQLSGMTALMAAAHHGRTEVVQLLLSKGARPELRTPNGLNAATIAALEGRNEIVRLLAQRGTTVNADIARELAQERNALSADNDDEDEDREPASEESEDVLPRTSRPPIRSKPLRHRSPEE